MSFRDANDLYALFLLLLSSCKSPSQNQNKSALAKTCRAVNNLTITADKHEQHSGSPEPSDLFGIFLLGTIFFLDEGKVTEYRKLVSKRIPLFEDLFQIQYINHLNMMLLQIKWDESPWLDTASPPRMPLEHMAGTHFSGHKREITSLEIMRLRIYVQKHLSEQRTFEPICSFSHLLLETTSLPNAFWLAESKIIFYKGEGDPISNVLAHHMSTFHSLAFYHVQDSTPGTELPVNGCLMAKWVNGCVHRKS